MTDSISTSKKRFELQDRFSGHSVMGGLLGEDNVYVKTYGTPLEGQKAVRDLEVGESSLLRYRLSGTSGIYRLVRME